jgi:hypothetical protein
MRATVMAGMAGLLLLAGCGGSGSPDSGSAPCPRIAILADGADLTRFRAGAARDLTAMTVDARIAGFDASCDYTGRGQRRLDVRITPRFEAERGPGATDRSVDLPWFVALSDAGDANLLDRVASATRVTFTPNVARAQATGRPVRVSMPVGDGVRAGDYIIRLSFQLTPEELALNRQRGPR